MKKTKSIQFIKQITLVLIILSIGNLSVYSISPISCLAPTTENSGNDTSCNTSGTATDCLDYCPGAAASFSSSSVGTGIVVIYSGGTNFTILDSVIDETINCGTETCMGTVSDPNFVVTSGQAINFMAAGGSTIGIGWRSPDSSGMCGEAIPRTDGNGNYNPVSIGTLTAQVPDGYTIVSSQCWGDTAIGDSDFDFNDMMYVIAVNSSGTGGGDPTPTPTSTDPGSTITGTPTQLPKTGAFDDSFNLFLLAAFFISGGIGLRKIASIIQEKTA